MLFTQSENSSIFEFDLGSIVTAKVTAIQFTLRITDPVKKLVSFVILPGSTQHWWA